MVNSNSELSWDAIAAAIGGRSARQCRERYVNYLSPTIRHAPWSEAEDMLLVEKIAELGHTWAAIGRFFGGRTESDVKNRWYSHLKHRFVFDELHGRYRLVEEQSGVPPKKKRNRVSISPKVRAERAMREKNKTQIAQPDEVCEIWEDFEFVSSHDRDLWSDFTDGGMALFPFSASL
jgi:hypothetical protein